MPGAVYAKEAAAARHAKRGRESATAIRILGDRRGEDSHPGAHPAPLTHHGLHRAAGTDQTQHFFRAVTPGSFHTQELKKRSMLLVVGTQGRNSACMPPPSS